MLKRTITFKDWDDNPVTEEHYFNLNLTELMELDLEGIMKRLTKAQDTATVSLEIKKVILAAIGERDGKYFIKEDYVRKNFERTGAYNALILELSSDADSAGEFIKGLLPAELAAEYEKTLKEAAKESAPTSRTAELAAAQTDTTPPAA